MIGVTAAAADRSELARCLLRGMEERVPRDRSASAQFEGDIRAEVLPVAQPLARLLPGGGLRKGGTVAVSPGLGATSLLLALLAQASRSGAWVGVVGRPELGLVATAEAGLALERVALVPRPGADLVAVTAALLDGLDVVVVAGAERAGVRAADRQRLAARARQRGAVLVALGPWPGADTELSCADVEWEGPGAGTGRLRTRRVRVRVRGRGMAPGGRHALLLLPAPGGGITPDPGTERLDPEQVPTAIGPAAVGPAAVGPGGIGSGGIGPGGIVATGIAAAPAEREAG